jgi:hypothetical protein
MSNSAGSTGILIGLTRIDALQHALRRLPKHRAGRRPWAARAQAVCAAAVGAAPPRGPWPARSRREAGPARPRPTILFLVPCSAWGPAPGSHAGPPPALWVSITKMQYVSLRFHSAHASTRNHACYACHACTSCISSCVARVLFPTLQAGLSPAGGRKGAGVWEDWQATHPGASQQLILRVWRSRSGRAAHWPGAPAGVRRLTSATTILGSCPSRPALLPARGPIAALWPLTKTHGLPLLPLLLLLLLLLRQRRAWLCLPRWERLAILQQHALRNPGLCALRQLSCRCDMQRH